MSGFGRSIKQRGRPGWAMTIGGTRAHRPLMPTADIEGGAPRKVGTARWHAAARIVGVHLVMPQRST
jgi:hypothetical protein